MAETAPLPELDAAVLHRRRERVFLILAAIFLSTLAMLNILGISRFIVLASLNADEAGGWSLAWGQWGAWSFAVAVGVLPYPITFLCTDLISELYGKQRASFLVWVGLLVNLWVVFVLWLGGILPMQAEFVEYGVTAMGDTVTGPPLPEPIYNAEGQFVRFDEEWTFYRMQMLAFGAVTASMVAYLAAQFVDVYVFHFWKKLTNGRHLWLRNNGSTLVSQLVDTVAVILITHFYARALPVTPDAAIGPQLLVFIVTGYVFKLAVALLDTGPFYLGAIYLGRYLRINPTREHQADEEESHLFADDQSTSH